MQTSSKNDTLCQKEWEQRTVREKAEVITAFLNECGEHARWEDWRDFLNKYEVSGFEWTESVD